MAAVRASLVLAVVVLFVIVPDSHTHQFINENSLFPFEKSRVQRDETITLSATPSKLEVSGSWVSVKWHGVPDPNSRDLVAVYSPTDGIPGNIDPSKHYAIKYIEAQRSPNYLKTGSGSYHFRLINFRAPIYFTFIRYQSSELIIVAISNAVTFSNYNEPLQVHLSLSNDSTKMVVVWSSLNHTDPMVRWGTSPQSLPNRAPSSSSTYTQKDMCGPPAATLGWRDPGLIHKAVMTGLTPGKRYYYQVGDTYGYSPVYHFSAPLAAGAKITTRVVAYGDMGFGQPDGSTQHWEEQPSLETTKRVTEMVNNSEVDVVLHIGDISYAVGYSAQWDEFFDQIQPVASRVPYMVCIGNHERDYPDSGALFDAVDSGGECGVPYERRLAMPRPSPDEPWYAFEYGLISFVLMSTEHNFSVGSHQYQFLEKILAKVDRNKTPWLVFSGHRPMYVDSNNNDSSTGDLPVSKLLISELEPLLLKYKVDMALWGHHHSYQRTCPLVKYECVVGGVTHVVIGMAGQGLSKDIKKVKPVWTVVLDDQHYGYTHFTADETALLFEYVRNDDGKVHDSFTLKK